MCLSLDGFKVNWMLYIRHHKPHRRVWCSLMNCFAELVPPSHRGQVMVREGRADPNSLATRCCLKLSLPMTSKEGALGAFIFNCTSQTKGKSRPPLLPHSQAEGTQQLIGMIIPKTPLCLCPRLTKPKSPHAAQAAALLPAGSGSLSKIKSLLEWQPGNISKHITKQKAWSGDVFSPQTFTGHILQRWKKAEHHLHMQRAPSVSHSEPNRPLL